jgi:hypothetical protein
MMASSSAPQSFQFGIDATLRRAEPRAAKTNEARTLQTSSALKAWPVRSSGFNQLELGQRGHAVVEADLLCNLPIDHTSAQWYR